MSQAKRFCVLAMSEIDCPTILRGMDSLGGGDNVMSCSLWGKNVGLLFSEELLIGSYGIQGSLREKRVSVVFCAGENGQKRNANSKAVRLDLKAVLV